MPYFMLHYLKFVCGFGLLHGYRNLQSDFLCICVAFFKIWNKWKREEVGRGQGKRGDKKEQEDKTVEERYFSLF